MKRRTFMAIIGVITTAWPLALRAQPPAMPVVGFFGTTSMAPNAPFVAAFRQGLKDSGFEGQNVTIEFRWAEGRQEQAGSLRERV
jgi:putative ABC transport system substrate-binding protein